MKILVTGAKGFIGKNLIVGLKNRNYNDIFEFDKDSEPVLLDQYCESADFVFHFAGVNRTDNKSRYMEGNFGFTSELLDTLKKHKNICPVMFASSIQASLDNPYGKSKKACEDLLFGHAKKTGSRVLVYRLQNIFGKWCRPNYNSVVATFCHNIANDLPIIINGPDVVMNLVYIDDLIEELVQALEGKENRVGIFCEVPVVHTVSVGEINDKIYSFKKSRVDLSIPNMADSLTKKLYSTYLSYLPQDKFSYPLKIYFDQRGSFSEMIKTPDRGQISVNISKPGITKGNHWHHTKNEKFLIVSGQGVIRFRKIFSEEIIEYYVSGAKLEVVEVPPGYTHNIENLGDTDMITIIWANEPYNPNKPDTFFMEV